MESLKEFLHIELEWLANPENKHQWILKFEKDVLMSVDRKGWFFDRYFVAHSASENWHIKINKYKRGSYYHDFKKMNLLRSKLFRIGFKKKDSLGMFNPTKEHSFLWKKLGGKMNGIGWHLNDTEIIRFERKGRSISNFNYTVSIVNNDFNEKWISAMIISGFLAINY